MAGNPPMWLPGLGSPTLPDRTVSPLPGRSLPRRRGARANAFFLPSRGERPASPAAIRSTPPAPPCSTRLRRRSALPLAGIKTPVRAMWPCAMPGSGVSNDGIPAFESSARVRAPGRRSPASRRVHAGHVCHPALHAAECPRCRKLPAWRRDFPCPSDDAR